MRGETKERWRELCERIIVEQDPDKLLTTIEELLQVLEEREEITAQRRVRVPLSEKPYITCPVPQIPVSLGLVSFGSSSLVLVLFIHRRTVVSGAPFHQEWVSAKTLPHAFDVQVQCFPKFDQYRPNFLVAFLGKKFQAQSANPVFHTEHCAPASDTQQRLIRLVGFSLSAPYGIPGRLGFRIPRWILLLPEANNRPAIRALDQERRQFFSEARPPPPPISGLMTNSNTVTLESSIRYSSTSRMVSGGLKFQCWRTISLSGPS